MIFIVYDPYNDIISDFTSDEPQECFICYDIKTLNEPRPIYLNKQNFFYKTCMCDGLVHKECLQIWFKHHKKCPICRVALKEKLTFAYVVFTVVYHTVYFFIFLEKFMMFIFKFISIYCLVYAVYRTYLLIIYYYYLKFENEDYSFLPILYDYDNLSEDSDTNLEMVVYQNNTFIGL